MCEVLKEIMPIPHLSVLSFRTKQKSTKHFLALCTL